MNDSRTPCWWCSHGSELDIGPGYFRDFDSDFSYGIPVCGGCGGLGFTADEDFFRENVKNMLQARQAYCTVDKDIPIPDRIEALEKIVSLSRALFEKYGKKGDGSFAEKVYQGGLDNLLEEYISAIKKAN